MKTSKIKLKIGIPFLILFVITIGCVYYINDYYRSDDSVKIYLTSTDQVKVTKVSDGLLFDGTKDDTALIFYPGAKVEYTAYAPLLYKLAEQGIDCFLVHMPCNLAIFGQNKAESILDSYSYETWYIAGHSLGGAMAASYAAKNSEQLNGLILLAAYPTKSLKDKNLNVLSLYGSEDKVINTKKREEGRNLMPLNYTELCIKGGNHAYFGNYGEQKKDGIASISREEQQEQVIKAIIKTIQQ